MSLVAAAGVGYWFFVSKQREYIVGRDFRILTNLTKQIDSTARAEVKVIQNLPKPAGRDKAEALRETWSKLRGKPYKPSDIIFRPNDKQSAGALTEPTFRPNSLVLEVPLEDADKKPLTASLNLQPGIETLFGSTVGPGAFDAILLGTRDGQVLVSAGSGAEQLRFSGLDVLSSKPAEGGTPRTFAQLSQAITMTDVNIGGVDYTLFIAPCCLMAKTPADRFVIAGLVRSELVSESSRAIPTTLVKVSVLVLLLTLVGWPFLKLILLGDRQQVGVGDFFQLGASSVAGLALLTVVLLDISAYWRLNRDLDAQLSDLAHALDDNAAAEIAEAYAQLTCIEQKVGRLKTTAFEDNRVGSVLKDPRLVCAPGASLERAVANPLANDPPVDWTYPFFETVTFVDTQGQQTLKLAASANVSNLISVGEREYFKTIANGRGWTSNEFCGQSRCALESVWSLTTGEAQAVLAKETALQPGVSVAAISFSMRSLIGPVLPPGFAFAVIDRTGRVLFHSDRQRNGNENFFVEADNNRRLRAQVKAHSADGLNIDYWGEQYRAYMTPMRLPGMYVVAMAQVERTWAINREWLVVSMTLVAVYLLLWLGVALFTLVPGASWVWPDPKRRWRYFAVSVVCSVLLLLAIRAALYASPTILVLAGLILPLAGWSAAWLLLRSTRERRSSGGRETLVAYSVASVLVLLVSGVIPGALFFLASYRLHAWSYIKNGQLIVAHRIAERYDRLRESYVLGPAVSAKTPAANYADAVVDRDIYVKFLYDTSVDRLSDADYMERLGDEHHSDDMLLSLLEDWLPYYSEASVEWRELLHDRAHDGTWVSSRGANRLLDVQAALAARTGKLSLELKSWVPSITHVPPVHEGKSHGTPDAAEARTPAVQLAAMTPAPAARLGAPRELSAGRDSMYLLSFYGIGLAALAWGIVQVFKRRIYLVGITEPLWACGSLIRNAGQNVFVFCDAASKARLLEGLTPLALGPIVKAQDFRRAWREALFNLDQKSDDGSVLIADFDEELEDAPSMDRKLLLLDELVLDPSRRVVVLSTVSIRGLTDSVRHFAGASSAAPEARDVALARWDRDVKALVSLERREVKEPPPRPAPHSPAETFLLAERDSHPTVRRICNDLLQSDATIKGRLTRAQAFDELVERTAQFYRAVWTSCSEDEKVVLGHVAKHGLANASARSVVRQLLGRGLLRADPALRPMNETFRHFILTRECSNQVAELENQDGPSAWDRLRIPLGLAVVGAGVFLFATQKELYNAIFGLVTAAAASVPTLIDTVGKLVGRPIDGPGAKA